MQDLDIVNASVIEPVLKALPFRPGLIESTLERSGLPASLLYQADGLVPLYAAKGFLCQIALAVGDDLFPFHSIQNDDGAVFPGELTIFNPPSGAIYLTGLDGAKDFVGKLDSAITGTRFFWTLEGGTFWVLRTAYAARLSELWPVVQYNLSAMLRGMQQLFGPDLLPTAVRTGSQPAPTRLPTALLGIPVQSGPEIAGLGFDATRLFRIGSMQRPRKKTAGPTAYQQLDGLNEATLSACILQFLQNGATDHLGRRAAAAFGMSPRTYQRRLAEMGTSHSVLRNNARFSAACQMLNDSDRSMTAISLDLGYAHSGDFTRFFRRRTGITPSQYRALL
ncbi:MAG: AraC-like DNA-binding protein [Paracoccaceae bacterium]|jgi:AraC-like DNA-binding protein